MAVDSGKYLSKAVRGADGILVGKVVAAAGHYLVVERVGGGDLALRTSEVVEAEEVVRLRLPAAGYLAHDAEPHPAPAQPAAPTPAASPALHGGASPAAAGPAYASRYEYQDDGQLIGDDFDERRSHIPNLHGDDELFI